MDISAASSPNVPALLTDTLDRDVIDLATHLDELAARLRRAYHGLTITIADNGTASFTFTDADTDPSNSTITSTLPAPPTAVSGTSVGSMLILDSSALDAFIDGAADQSDPVGIDAAAGGLGDGASALTAGCSFSTGLQRYSTINQAIGVLMDGGRTLESALEELKRLANHDLTELYRAAEVLIHDLAGRQRNDESPPATP